MTANKSMSLCPNTQYYPILENIGQYPILQCQYRSNPRIFNQSSPDFYPQWSLAVTIQSHCWNYPTMSRFGQTGDQKYFGPISNLTEEVGQGQGHQKVGHQDGVV